MSPTTLIENWPKAIALILLTAFLFWGFHCTPTVPSLLIEGKNITRPELQIEMDTITATAAYRIAQLDKQDAFRNVLFENAFAMAKGNGINPIGIITLLAGLYGVTRGVKDAKDKIAAKRSVNA